MNNIIKRIEIDLYSPTSYEVIIAQQGDNISRTIEFVLYNQGEPYIFTDEDSDILAVIDGRRGDHSSFMKECLLEDNIITAELDSNILYEAGTIQAKIFLYDDKTNTILSTIPFLISVQKDPCDKNRIETEKSSAIDWLILQFHKLKTSFSSHMKDFSNPHKVTKEQVDLGNVDNTSDMDKPVSTAQQDALDKKANIESPVLTGTPEAPTASVNNNSTQIATTAFTQSVVSNHNTADSSHEDIRNLISVLSTRLNTLADSDDTTLDQLSEIVAYIKSNRTLIENVTTNKVNVSDIINNLTSTDINKPLSAKQGKIINDLITELTENLNNKVDKVNGKGLSTNDYTDEEKAIVASISSGTVTGIKGNAESTYRTGNVNITKENIGLGNVANERQYSASNPQPSVEKLKTPRTIDGVSFDGSEDILHFGVCSEIASMKTKYVSIPGFKLVEGARIFVLFENGNTAQSATLNVNFTGDKNIVKKLNEGSALITNDFDYGIYEFIYHNNAWNLISNSISDDIVEFISDDVIDKNATRWSSISNLTSRLSLRAIMYKVSIMFKNVRYLHNFLGGKDISKIGDGTVTGAINFLNGRIKQITTSSSGFGSSLTAGANGYVQISGINIPEDAIVISIRPQIGAVSLTKGLQLTPAYVGGGNLYIHYYAPSAIATNSLSSFNWIITYLEQS